MPAPSLLLTIPFVGTPAYFSGTGSTTLVPSTFPVAINGRPYMVDQKSGKFARGYEQRVRDSQDNSTAPGEAAINPGGLWRRGQDSWHFGAGQQYADVAGSMDYQFYKSKGINPWVKGQVSLHRDTKLSLTSTATAGHLVVAGSYVYVSLNGDLKYSTNPYAATPTWTDCTGEPGGTCAAMATDGTKVYACFPSDGIRVIDPTTLPGTVGSKLFTSSHSYYMIGFAKNYLLAAFDSVLHLTSSSGSGADIITPTDTSFRWVGVATGQNAVYAAGYAGQKSLIYKITIKTDGTLDTGVVALELPTGEIVSSISGYLGTILLGTNKGVRYCTTDSNSNLNAGPIIPTGSAVQKFTSEDRFAYFTWTNYDGVSSGLGRLDLSTFTGTNAPAFATDLMYTSTNAVLGVVTFDSKRIFLISGVGVVAENVDQLVASGTIEGGTWRWGIPDRKFVAKVDARSEPLKGSITAYLSTDNAEYSSLGTWNTAGQTEFTFEGSDTKTIEAAIKFTLTRGATVTEGPVFTRWMARAYAAPFRSQVFVVPVLLHHKLSVKGKDYYLNVQDETDALDNLISSPSIVTLQIGTSNHSVIVEDVEWTPLDSYGNTWEWEGTATVTMRSVEN